MKLFPVLLLFLAGAHAAVLTKRAGGFHEHCKEIETGEVEGGGSWLMNAKCGTSPHPIGINLDGCIANRNGKLAWQKEGKFSESCKCHAVSPGEDDAPGLYLNCQCKNKKGGMTLSMDPTDFNLNDRITYTPPAGGGDHQGKLSC